MLPMMALLGSEPSEKQSSSGGSSGNRRHAIGGSCSKRRTPRGGSSSSTQTVTQQQQRPGHWQLQRRQPSLQLAACRPTYLCPLRLSCTSFGHSRTWIAWFAAWRMLPTEGGLLGPRGTGGVLQTMQLLEGAQKLQHQGPASVPASHCW